MIQATFDMDYQGATYTVTGNYWPFDPGVRGMIPPESSQFEVTHVSCDNPPRVLPDFTEGDFPRAAWERADEVYRNDER